MTQTTTPLAQTKTPPGGRGSTRRATSARSRRGGQIADEGAELAALDLELLHAVGQREQGVGAADADVEAGMKMGAALAEQDITRRHLLVAEAFDAEALRMGVAAVAAAAACFLVCHGIDLSRVNRR